jgi:dUTP pyrophosphatase
MEEFDDINDKDIKDLMDILESMSDEETDDVDYDLIMKTFGLDVPELEKEMENFVPTIDLNYTKSNENSVNPKYAYPSDSGFDLYSIEDSWIHPNDRKLIPTGLHFDIPDGYEIQVRSKSGLALNQGLFVLNSHGTVDCGYTGEIKVILFNTTNQKVKIEKGQKIAQAVLCPVVNGKWVTLVEKNKLEDKDRNQNGFGSTNLF